MMRRERGLAGPHWRGAFPASYRARRGGQLQEYNLDSGLGSRVRPLGRSQADADWYRRQSDSLRANIEVERQTDSIVLEWPGREGDAWAGADAARFSLKLPADGFTCIRLNTDIPRRLAIAAKNRHLLARHSAPGEVSERRLKLRSHGARFRWGLVARRRPAVG
jgi:hypothetical protein